MPSRTTCTRGPPHIPTVRPPVCPPPGGPPQPDGYHTHLLNVSRLVKLGGMHNSAVCGRTVDMDGWMDGTGGNKSRVFVLTDSAPAELPTVESRCYGHSLLAGSGTPPRCLTGSGNRRRRKEPASAFSAPAKLPIGEKRCEGAHCFGLWLVAKVSL
jgi:hypothetical protein